MDDANSIIGNSYSWGTDNQWDLAPSMTHTRGKHTMHYGGEISYRLNASGDLGRANGQLDFRRGWTQQYSGRSQGQLDGSGVASLLLGYPQSGYVEWRDTFYRTSPYFAFYMQDDWKVTPKLTLNLGLRYDFVVPFKERYNRVNSGFDFNVKNPLSDQITANWKKLKAEYDATNPQWPYPNSPEAIYGGKVFAGVNGQPEHTYYTDWQNIQPRVGFAYQVLPKTVLRGGFGIFHKYPTQGNLTDGFTLSTNYVSSLDGLTPSAGASLIGPYSLEDPFPNGASRPPGSSLGYLTNAGRGIGFDGRQRVIPRTYEYSLTIERELPLNTYIEASYSGNHTVHDTVNLQLDAVSWDNFLRAQQTPLFLDRRLPNPFLGIVPSTADFGNSSTVSAYQLTRPLPLFNGITENTNPWGWYHYDSLQLKLEKRAFQSREVGVLTFVVSYTFSKSYEANHRLNDWNLKEPPIHELDYQDKPQSIAFSGVWDLPIGKGRRLSTNNRFGNVLLSGWTFDWILTYYSGYPVGKPDAIFSCGDYRAIDQTSDHWFNNDKSCYADRPPYTLRVVEDRFSNIRNPAELQINLAIGKNIKLSEHLSVLLKGESFNVTNTPILRGPDTNWKSTRFGMLPVQQNNFPRLVQLAAKIIF
jgi:hypothetical protein